MKNVYTSIDVSSDSVKVVVCQLFNNKLNLLAVSSVKSEGINKGTIVNEELVISAIKKAVNEVEEMLGIEIKKVITSIPSNEANYILGKGKTSISEAGVLGKDIANVLENSTKSIDIGNREIVNIIPIDFDLDDQKGLIDPRGRAGKVLTTRTIITTVPKKNLYGIASLLEKTGLEIVDITLNTVGDIYALKNKMTENKMGAIINIGYDETSIAIYNKNIAIKSSVIDLGSKNIDNDISYIYKLSLADSIKVKDKFALAHKRYAGKNNYYEIVNKLGEKTTINQFEISEVVMSRIEEILVLARKEINLLTKREVDYIIITGGTSSMDNFKIVADEVLGSVAQVGDIKILGIRNNKYSSVVGNIVYFINKLRLRNIDYSMIDDYEYEEEKNFNDTMLGKVFGYFFKED